MHFFFATPDRQAQTFLVVAFLISRVVFYALGIRLDTTTLYTMWQIVDPVWLRKELIETLFYLHGQPPLFNFIVGSVAKLPEAAWTPIWSGLFAALGLALCITIYKLCRIFAFGLGASAATAFIFAISPQAILFENWLLYTYPTALLLTLGTYLSVRYLRTGSSSVLWGAVFSFTAVCLLRSMFHLAWLIVLFGIIWWAAAIAGHSRKRAATALLTGIAIVASIYFKNFLLFDSFSASSWFGMTLLQTVYYQRSWDWQARAYEVGNAKTVDRLLAQGKLSAAAQYGAFSQKISEDAMLKAQVTRPDVRLLARPFKSKSRYANYNYEPYIGLSRLSQQDALTLLNEDPNIYLRNLSSNVYRSFLKPSFDYIFLVDNAKHIIAWNKTFYALLLRDSLSDNASTSREREEKGIKTNQPWLEDWHAAYLLPFIVVIALGYAALRGTGAAFGLLIGEGSTKQIEWLLIAWIVFWAFMLPVMLTGFEAHRMRFMIEPLLLVTFLVAARDIVQVVQRKLS